MPSDEQLVVVRTLKKPLESTEPIQEEFWSGLKFTTDPLDAFIYSIREVAEFCKRVKSDIDDTRHYDVRYASTYGLERVPGCCQARRIVR